MPTIRLRRLLPVLLLTLHPAHSAAQTTNTLLPGDEVRVHAPAVLRSRVRGTVVLYQGSTLDVRQRNGGTVVSIPVASIEDLARNVGVHRGRSSWRMARFGAFLGGAAGLVSGPLIATTRAPDNFGQVMAVSAVVGTLGGAGLGAMLGAAFPRDEWQHFRMPIIPTLRAGEGSVQVGAAAQLP